MNKYIYKIIMAAFVLAFLLPIQVFAQGDDSFQLDTQGNVTLTSSHAAREGISSLQFSLKIDSNSADKVEFQFNPNTAKVSEFRYHEDTGILNVYIAGTEALFAENVESLTIGKVVVLDTSQNGAPATVSVVADSFQYVYGTELRKAEELLIPEAVMINGGSGDPGGTQMPPATDSSQGSGSSSSGSREPDNSNNTQSQENSDLSGNTTPDSQNMASPSPNTTSGAQSSGSNASNRRPQISGSNGLSSTPPAENYTRLKQTFETARKFKKEDYSSESYEALQTALAKAEEVLGDSSATSKEIDEVLMELENAIGALVTRDDVADDSQQLGEQETGDTSEQIVDASAGIEEEDASNESRLPILLLIVGILVLVGCGTAVAVIKIKSTQK